MVEHSARARNGRPAPLPAGPLTNYAIRLRLPRGVIIAGGVSDLPAGRTFHKTIHAEHFLQSPRAIGLSTAVVDLLRRSGVQWLLVRHARHGTEYRAALNTFVEHSFTQRRDEDLQAFLTLEHWTIRHPILEAETPAPSPQLALFEVAV